MGRQHMNNQEILEQYKPLVAFIADLMGPECEVLLHDVFHPEKSVIAISNGYLSGRDIGSPLTDFAKQMIQDNRYSEKQYLANYLGSSKGRKFVSSTFFIKNEGQIIGMLCINRDMSLITDVSNMLEAVKIRFNLNPLDEEVVEVLDDVPVNQMLEHMVRNCINEYGRNAKRLTKNEKTAIVNQLKTLGAFSMKGAVGEIARQLGVSEPTIYRYLNHG